MQNEGEKRRESWRGVREEQGLESIKTRVKKKGSEESKVEKKTERGQRAGEYRMRSQKETRGGNGMRTKQSGGDGGGGSHAKVQLVSRPLQPDARPPHRVNKPFRQLAARGCDGTTQARRRRGRGQCVSAICCTLFLSPARSPSALYHMVFSPSFMLSPSHSGPSFHSPSLPLSITPTSL